MLSKYIFTSSETAVHDQLTNYWDISAEQISELLKCVPEGETQTVMTYLSELMTPLASWLYWYRLSENRLDKDRSDVSDMAAFDFTDLHNFINNFLSGPTGAISVGLEKNY